MKNHRILICILLSLTSLSLFAQEKSKLAENVEYSISKSYPEVKGVSHCFKIKNVVFKITVQFSMKGMVFQKFGTDELSFQLTKKQEFNLWKNELEGFLVLDENLYMFYSRWIKERQTEQLFCREIDVENCTLKKGEKLLLEVDHKIMRIRESISSSIPVEKIKSFGKFRFEKSFNEKNVAICYVKYPDVKRDSKSFLKVGFSVFNSSLNKLWSNEYRMPYTEKMMHLNSFSVDDNSNVNLELKIAFDKKGARERKKNKLVKHRREIHVFSKDKTDIYHIDSGNKVLNGDLVNIGFDSLKTFSAFYSRSINSFEDHINGVVTYELVSSKKETKETLFEVSKNVLDKYSIYFGLNSNVQSRNLEFSEVYKCKDKGTLLIGERHKIRTDFNGERHSKTHFFGDILVAKIAKDGTLEWMGKLPRNHKGITSYKYFETSDAYCLLYLDNIKNENLKTDEAPQRHVKGKGGILTLFKLNKENGNFSRKALIDLRNVEGYEIQNFSSEKVLNIGDNQIMFEAQLKGKGTSMIRVQY